MSNATTGATIREHEAAHFGALAADWWEPKGASAMLHKLNPVRLSYLRDCLDAHWPDSADSLKPLVGKSALDVGCGAGLLAEPLARLGAAVTGVDAAPENIAAAQDHAKGAGLAIDYRAGELAAQGLGTFDMVTAMEVIEHVADKQAFISELSRHLAPGGLMVLSTPNRTARSRLVMIELAERTGMIPRGTHHWDDFITPEELGALLETAGLAMSAPQGIAFTAMKGLHLSADLSLNYLVSAIKA